jgi:hypothetical protein
MSQMIMQKQFNAKIEVYNHRNKGATFEMVIAKKLA